MALSEEQTSRFRALQRYEQVAERLAADIRSGVYAPGSRLPSERELARVMEGSRASVREAIGALQVQGVVETRPGAGTGVASRPPAAGGGGGSGPAGGGGPARRVTLRGAGGARPARARRGAPGRAARRPRSGR